MRAATIILLALGVSLGLGACGGEERTPYQERQDALREKIQRERRAIRKIEHELCSELSPSGVAAVIEARPTRENLSNARYYEQVCGVEVPGLGPP